MTLISLLYICMLSHLYFDACTQIENENVVILIECDFLQIAKINSQQNKTVFPNGKNGRVSAKY